MPNDQNTSDTGLIPAETAARLLMLEQREFDRIVRSGSITAEAGGRFRVVAVVQGYLRHLASERNAEATGTALAAHLFCTRETLSDYVARGVVEKLPSGKYDLNASRERVMKHLRDRAAGRTGDTTDNLASARADLAKEQRDAIAIKNAIARGDYVSLTRVKRMVQDAYSVIRERFLTVPGKIADSCSMRTREEIDGILRDEIEDVLNELSNPIGDAGDQGDSGSPS